MKAKASLLVCWLINMTLAPDSMEVQMLDTPSSRKDKSMPSIWSPVPSFPRELKICSVTVSLSIFPVCSNNLLNLIREISHMMEEFSFQTGLTSLPTIKLKKMPLTNQNKILEPQRRVSDQHMLPRFKGTDLELAIYSTGTLSWQNSTKWEHSTQNALIKASKMSFLS